MNYFAEVLRKFNTGNRNSNVSRKRNFESMDRIENDNDLEDEVIFLQPEQKRFKGEAPNLHHTAVKSSWGDWFKKSAKRIAFWRKANNSVVYLKSSRPLKSESEMSRNKNWGVMNYPFKESKIRVAREPLCTNQSEVFNPFIGELRKSAQINTPLIDLESDDENNEGKSKLQKRNKGETSSRRRKSLNRSRFLSLPKSSPSKIMKKNKTVCVKVRRNPTNSKYSTSHESFQLQEKEFYRLLLESQSKRDEGLNSISVETQTQGSKSGAFFKVNVTDTDKLYALNKRLGKHRTIEQSPWDKKLKENEQVFKSPISLVPVPLKASFASSSLMQKNIPSHSMHLCSGSVERLGRKELYRSHETIFSQTSSRKARAPEYSSSQEYFTEKDLVKSVVPKFFPSSKFEPSKSNSEGRKGNTRRSMEMKVSPHVPLQRSYSARFMNPDKDLFSDEWLKALKQDVDKSQRVNNEKVDDQEKQFLAMQEEKQKKMFEENRKCIESIESKFTTLYLNKYVDSEVEDDDDYQLPALTSDMEAEIEKAMQPNPASEVLTQGFGINITRKDIETLAGLNWLNDEIINFYTNLLMERGKGKGYPSCYAFNTFFYPRLISSGHVGLKRWTRKIDVFSYDLLLVPVHLGMHWCLAAYLNNKESKIKSLIRLYSPFHEKIDSPCVSVKATFQVIDFRHKKIQYYDSMGGINNDCLNALKSYLVEESRDKKKAEFDITGWKFEAVKNIPQQMNGSDCGMFTCKYAEYITRNAKITFTQRNMPYFRRRMVYEIIKKQLL